MKYLAFSISVVLLAHSGSASQSPQDLPFPRSSTPGAGVPQAGDFDGDGVVDLALEAIAVGFNPSPGVTLRRGLGLGFSAPDEGTPLPNAPSVLRVADFDGDGRDDLVGAAIATKRLYLLQAFASPSFSLISSFPYAATSVTTPPLVEKGDFNGDGRVDVLVLPSDVGAAFQVFLNDGLGGFGAAVSTAAFPSSTSYKSMTVADFDNDGMSDVAYEQRDQTLYYQLAVGGGGFGPPLTAAVGMSQFGVRSGDVDGDGNTDVLCGIYHLPPPPQYFQFGVIVAHGDGAGGFVMGGFMQAPDESSGAWMPCDLDVDGTVDMLSATGHYFLGLGGGSFAPVQQFEAVRFSGCDTQIDVNQDGLPDLIATSNSSYTTMFATAPLTYPYPLRTNTTTGYAAGIAAADFNGDGKLDLAVGDSQNNRLVWMPGDGQGGFAAPIPISSVGLPLTVACADFDGDGDQDVVAGSWISSAGTVVLSDGAGGFQQPPTIVPLGGAPHEVIAEDLNGDGLADIAAACTTGSRLSFAQSLGSGTFAPAQLLGMPAAARGLCSLDANGDGVRDLAVTCPNAGVVQLAMGSASGTFSLGGTISTGVPWRIASGDIDLDGDDDLVVTSNVFSVFQGDGAGAFTFSSALTVPSITHLCDVSVTDLDGDTFNDIVGVGIDGCAVWARGNGRGEFAAVRWYAGIHLLAKELSFALEDFTGDGRRDFAVPSSSPPFVIVLPQLGVAGLPLAYCLSRTTSNGCVPAIEWDGLPRASAVSGFTIRARDVINRKSGLLVYGVSGPAATPFAGGTLCVAPAVKRTVGTNSGGSPLPTLDCSGVFEIDFAAFAHGALGGTPSPGLVVPGTRVAAQWIGRDPGFAPPGNLIVSDAVLWNVFP